MSVIPLRPSRWQRFMRWAKRLVSKGNRMNGMYVAAQRQIDAEPSSAEVSAERRHIEAQWLAKTTAEDVLNEMLIDHEDALNAAFDSGDARVVGELVLGVRAALAARYAKRWAGDFGIGRLG